MINNGKKLTYLLFGIFIAFWIGFGFFYNIKNHNEKELTLNDLKKKKTLVVCCEEDSLMFGFNYEVAKAYANYNKLELIYIVQPDFSKRKKMLISGKCDFIACPLPALNQFRDDFLFSEPLYNSRLLLIQRNEPASKIFIRNQVKLSGKKICIPKGSPHIIRLKNLAEEISDSIEIKEVRVFDNGHLINLIKRRRFNYAACDEYVAKAYSKRDSTIDINTPLSFRQRQSWASRKVNINVVNDFNNFYKLYQKSPAFARLNEIYFN